MLPFDPQSVQIVKTSFYFDEAWYLDKYPDVGLTKLDPAMHYLRLGWRMDRDPGPNFNTQAYLQRHPDLREQDICPLVHAASDRKSTPTVPEKTPERSTDGAASGSGSERLTDQEAKISAAIEKSRLFDAEWYIETYSEAAQSSLSPAEHYVCFGMPQLYNPGPNFSTRFYLQKHADVRKAGLNALNHYEGWGRREGRVILPAYLDSAETDPAIAASARKGDADLWPADQDAGAYLAQKLTARAHGEPVHMYQAFDCEETERFVAALEHQAKVQPEDEVLVSIIMPTYNRAAIIGKAIISVLRQSWSNFELLIVDDGSTDNTTDVLATFTDPRVRVLTSGHTGVSGARNVGLEQARGEVIFYLDSDNEWTPDFLWLMMHAMSHSGARCGYGGTRLQSPNGFLIGYRGEPFNWEACLASNFVDMNVFCHHKDMIAEIGIFDTGLRRMVDWDLILRYTRDETVFYAPVIGCIYYEDSVDMNRITTTQPIVSRKLIHDRNALNCDLVEAAANLSFNIAIKIFAPYGDRDAWGDYHYAESLAEALQRQGHKVRIDFRGQWYDHPISADDVAIVLRGLEAYEPRNTQLSIFWGISHPDTVTPAEYDRFHGIFVASRSYAELLEIVLDRPVHTLMQCTDTTRFFPPQTGDRAATQPMQQTSEDRGIFIGNSRKEYRQIVRWAVEADLPLDVIGQDWDAYLPSDAILAANAPNKGLAALYGSASFVLNDHWESMRDFGFVSNRVFDVLAAGGQLISDRLHSIEALFGGNVVSVSGSYEVLDAVNKGAMSRSLAQRKALSDAVHRAHSFDHRAATLTDWITNYLVPGAAPKQQKASMGPDQSDGPQVNWAPRTRVGVLAPWSSPERMGSTVERLVAPLTTDAASAEVELVRLETAQDLHAADVSALVISASGLAEPDTDMTAAVKSCADGGKIVFLDTNQMPRGHGWSQLGAAFAGIWCDSEPTETAWKTQQVTQLKPCLDPRIWRYYRNPRPIEDAPEQLRIVAIFGQDFGDLESTDVAGLVGQISRIQEDNISQISLQLIGVDQADDMPVRPWITCTPWPQDCTTYLRKARWLIDNATSDIGIISCPTNDHPLLHLMALGIKPVAIAPKAGSLARGGGDVIAVCETAQDLSAALLAIMAKRATLLHNRSEGFETVWRDHSTLAAPNTRLTEILAALRPSAQKVC